MVIVLWLEFNVHILVEFNDVMLGVMLGVMLLMMMFIMRCFVVNFDGELSLDFVQKLG